MRISRHVSRLQGLVAALVVSGVAAGLVRAQPLRAQPQRLEQGRFSLELTLEKRVGSDWTAVDPGRVFESGDRVRFRVTPNFDGYLYVTNRGTSGGFSTLFPTEQAGMDNAIQAGTEYTVPETDGLFRIDGPGGHEVVYWMVSPTPLAVPDQAAPEYEPLPKAPDAPAPKPEMLPRCDETIMRARGECVDSTAGLRSQKGGDTAPAVRSRQLVFVQKSGASVVTAPEKLEGPVIFEFRIAHR